MNIIIPSLMTLFLAYLIIFNIISRFSAYTILILAIVSLLIVLYNNFTTFGDEYKFFIDLFDTFGGRLMFVVIIGGIIVVVLGFISKIDIIKLKVPKIFSSTTISSERLREIEKQL